MNENNTDNSSETEEGNTQGAAAQAASSGFDLQKVIEDAKAVLTDPAAFYKNMPTQGGLAEPAIYVAVMGLALGAVMAVFSLFGADRVGTMEPSFGALFFMPIMAVIGSFIAALVMFVIWKLMGSEADYETSYCCIAYATAIYPVMGVLGLVPYLGTIAGVLWGMYLIYCATLHVHKIKEETAKLVIGILAALSLFSQISTEIALRKIEKTVEQKLERASEAIGSSLGESLKDLENLDEMTPEEAGRKLGEFFKGMNEGMEEFEKGLEQGMEEGSK